MARSPLDSPPQGVARERVEADLARLFPATSDGSPRASLPAGVRRYRAGGAGLEAVDAAARGPGARRGGLRAAKPPTAQAIYAVGDVHGRYDLLVRLLGEIARDHRSCGDAAPPLLIFCGDYVDRGPQSNLVLEALVWLQSRGPWPLVLLKGNHEQVLLDFLDDPVRAAAWLQFGGAETLAAYGVAPPEAGDTVALARARDALLAAMPAAHLRLLERLDLAAEAGDHLFVHAGVAPGAPLRRQQPADLLWIRDEFLQSSRPCERVVVHGHTWTDASPTLLEHRIGLDTGAYRTGVLTAVRLTRTGRRVLQARDAAATRTSALVRAPADFTGGALQLNLALRADAA